MLTAAQRRTLTVAATEGPFRFHKGGNYAPGPGAAKVEIMSIRACIARGWMERVTVERTDPAIYGVRWQITEAGRAELVLAGAGL